jgi:Na+-driven multidrug efflux pump
VADTPGFSFVFNRYPLLVSDPDRARPEVARQNERLSWFSAAGTFIVASLAALLLYRLPILVLALPFVLLPMPVRYIGNFCDQVFRAAGMIRECAALTAVKIVVALLLFGSLTALWGFWGAVAAFGLNSLFGGLLYRRLFTDRFQGVLRPATPWRLA